MKIYRSANQFFMHIYPKIKKPDEKLYFHQALPKFDCQSDVAASLISAGRGLSRSRLSDCLVGLRKIVVAELSDFLSAFPIFPAAEILRLLGFAKIGIFSIGRVSGCFLIVVNLKVVVLIVCNFLFPCCI